VPTSPESPPPGPPPGRFGETGVAGQARPVGEAASGRAAATTPAGYGAGGPSGWSAPTTPKGDPGTEAVSRSGHGGIGQRIPRGTRPTGLPGPQSQPAATPAPPASPADKIAALRQSHTSMADDAAATIARAMAAASGSGTAAGLTRRQIREAERAAQEALRLQVQRTGELPAWDSAGSPGQIPPVKLQGEEEVGR
jgi:hypothetical protein